MVDGDAERRFVGVTTGSSLIDVDVARRRSKERESVRL